MIEQVKDGLLRLYVRAKNEAAGATAVEYGLMVALIAAVIILAVVFLGKETSGTFCDTGESIKSRGTDTVC